MTEILMRVMNIIQRIRNVQELNMFTTAIFAVVLGFGIMNCLFGYRLLRFWVMLFGFGVGAGAGALLVGYVGTEDKMYYLVGMVVCGIVLGAIAFFSYRAGIFILCAGTGAFLSVYILHPTTSAIFFACILIGIGLGCLGLKYCREVIVTVTSIAGGVLTGLAGAKLLKVRELPYGILLSVAAMVLGLLVQFLMNQPEYEEVEEEDRREIRKRQKDEEYFDELAYEEMEWEKQQRRLRRECAETEEKENIQRRVDKENLKEEEAVRERKRRRPDVAVDIKVGEE